MERRLVIEQFDPERHRPGGIDTCIRGLVKYCPPDTELSIVGVDAIGNKRLGEWKEYELEGRTVDFMPVARLDHSDLRRRVPHSARVAAGLLRYRPRREVDVVQTHRLNSGAFAMRLFPRARHVQFLHAGGVTDLMKGSQSFFQHSASAYNWLERYVLERAVDVVVFNEPGAQRLRSVSERVRFSPTWYDPADFASRTTESTDKTKILWACRIEGQKNPELAIDVMSAIPERYTLTVAGSGTMESAMRLRAQKSPAASRITFLGAIPKADIGELMRKHDLMLMTSRFEGYSRAVVEGLASGLPVVTTPGGEPNGLVQDGVNGARVPNESLELFGHAFDTASRVTAANARKSVSHLSAAIRVPDVLRIPS